MNWGSFLSRFTLQTKITVLVVVGLLSTIGVFTNLGLTALEKSTRTRLQERLVIARLVADYQDQVLMLALKRLEAAAARVEPSAQPPLAGLELEALNGSLSQLGINVVDAILFSKEGRATWEMLPYLRQIEWGMASYPSLWRTFETGEASVSGLSSIPSTEKPVVLLAHPVRATGGVLVVAAELTEASIGGFLKPMNIGQTGRAELVDANGMVLARTSPGQAPSYFEKSDHPSRFASLIALGQPMVGTCHRCHVEGEQTERRKDMLAFAPLSVTSWGVVIRQSEEEVLASTIELKTRLIIASALMSGITLILIWVATSDLVPRIKSLNTASLRMSAGDLSTRIPVRGRDEIGTLAQSLESTRVKLKTSYEEVEQRTRELGALLTISKTLTSVADFSSVLDVVVNRVVDVTPNADAGVLLLYDDEKDAFSVKSVVGVDSGEDIKGSTLSVHNSNGSQASKVLCAISPEVSQELHQLTETVGGIVLDLTPIKTRVQHSAAAPLATRGGVAGILVLMNFRENAPFTQADLRILQTLANDIAMALENAQLSRQAEEARLLRETDRLKSEFLSIVSHELRTPLTSIKGYTTSLLREDVTWDESTRREFLHTIDEMADELRGQVDKLLQMARVEAGGLELKREPVLLSRLAREVVDEMSHNSPRHKFVVDFPASFPVVEGDLDNLKIVLRNLVDNAVKYSPQGGNITITGRLSDGRVVVGVSDQGIGIPAGDLDKIFDRFYRVKSSLTRRIGGSGLGLSVVKALVEAQSGGVWVESSEGRGSTFYFSLPMESEPDGEADLRISSG